MQLQLDVQRFSASSQRNCFVRLHPSTIQRLYHQALLDFTNISSNAVNSVNGWHITQEDEKDIVFLPLKISFQPNEVNDTNITTMYVSYNGGISSQGTF